jgi:methionyl-tRNA formyltransferase
MDVVFAGSPAPAAAILADVAASRHRVVLAVSQPDRPRGRSGRPTPTPMARRALDLGIDCIRPETVNDPEVLERLRATGARVLCVVAYGRILREPLLSEFTCVNVHFSVLPAYRGAAPVERALMDGVTETGVTIMRMDAGMDTGPVDTVLRTPVGPEEDAGAVLDRLTSLGGPALVETLDRIEAGAFLPTPQPEEGVSLAPKITDEDRLIDPGAGAAAAVDRIRALSPHVGVRCTIGGEPFKLWRARVDGSPAPDGLSVRDGRLVMGIGGEAVEILELQPPGKNRMSAADFLRGWRGALEIAL